MCYVLIGPRELEQSENLAKLQNNLSVNLAKTLQQTDQQHWTFIINNYLKKHETSLLEAVSAGLGEGGGGSIWTYPGCILFAVSLLTTLGKFDHFSKYYFSRVFKRSLPSICTPSKTQCLCTPK